MPTADALAGVRVVVTRPESQSDRLAALVRRQGAEPILFPTLEIAPLRPSAAQVEHLTASDTVIFISANAATHGYPILEQPGHMDKRIVAIGDATRHSLEAMGCGDVYSPGERTSSEELLKAPFLQDLDGRRVCIVRGRGGRETLRQTLESRGARVSYLECYRRRRPSHTDPRVLTTALDSEKGSLVVTATSVAGLTNLLEMMPEGYRQHLASRPLVVIGGRLREAALELGWLGPVLESPGGDEHLVRTIITWRSTHS